MEVKKNPKKQLENKRTDFFLSGLAFALLVVLGAFSYTQYDKEITDLGDFVIDEDLIIMENTVQEKKPPPPPPPPELEVIEDDEEIEEDQPDFTVDEIDMDTEIQDFSDDEDDEPEATNEIFEMFAVEKQATFKGGEDALRRYLAENIVYPAAARDAEVQGTVVVRFVVDKKGNISDLEILTPPKGFGLEDEAKRVLKATSGMWSPAEQRKQPVNVRFQIPINFQLF